MLINFIVLIVFIFVIKNSFIIITVNGDSMSPDLSTNDKLLIMKTYTILKYHRGQIVLLNINDKVVKGHLAVSPGYYVKKIVGLPGDLVHLNIINRNNADKHISNDIIIPDNHIYVCGNSENSIDSKLWGAVSNKAVVGIVLFSLTRKSVTVNITSLIF